MDALIKNLIRNKNPSNYMDYARQLVFEMEIERINSLIANCNSCEICSEQKSELFCNIDSKFLIISESPRNEIYPDSDSEEYEMLRKVFEYFSEYKLNEQAFINAVNCVPNKIVDNTLIKRAPTKKETQSCINFIKDSIRIIQPKAIILLGSVPLNIFKNESLMKERGNIFNINGIPTIATFSPSYFLELEGKRNKETINGFKNDFCDDIEKIINQTKEQ